MRSISGYFSWYLIVAMFLIGIAPRVEAGFSPSEAVNLAQFDRAADLQKIQKALEMKVVSERLAKLGLTGQEISQRLGLMSDEQIHRLALNLDEVMTGGDALGLIVVLLVIAILVVILLRITNHKVIVSSR